MTASNPTAGEPINPNDKPGGATYNGSKRPLYFTEQFLVVEDFKDEEHYHLGLSRRHNCCLHTPGVVAGLEVTIEAQPPASGKTELTVGSGIAIDYFGREIILAAPATITFDAPAGTYERFVVIAFKEVKSTDESDTKVPTGGRPGVKRAVQAPALQVTDTDPRTQWPRNLDDDRVVIGKLIKLADKTVGFSASYDRAGARIPTGGVLAFQQAIVDPADANQQAAPPVQAGLDFADGALRIRARVTDPVSLDTTQLVILRTTGNVGIGTTNPDAKLSIQQGVATAKALSVRKDAAGSVGIDFFLDRITAAGPDQSLTIAAKGTGFLLLNPASGPTSGHVGIRTGTLDLSDATAVANAIMSHAPGVKWDKTLPPTPTVFKSLQDEKDAPKPRLIIAGDVIILGRLLVSDITELCGRMWPRTGQA